MTYPVFPAASTAANGTHPLTTFRNGWYASYTSPIIPPGTVSGKPTTPSCEISPLLFNSGLAFTAVAARRETENWRTLEIPMMLE